MGGLSQLNPCTTQRRGRGMSDGGSGTVSNSCHRTLDNGSSIDTSKDNEDAGETVRTVEADRGILGVPPGLLSGEESEALSC